MKQVNFTHEGGFPLEQETLERLQTAYRSELYEAFKSHLGLKTDKNYIIAHATDTAKGWAVINKDENNLPLPGTLYPIEKAENTGYLKTTQTGTSLIYGNGDSKIAYYDYEAQYIDLAEYQNHPSTSQNTDTSSTYYYNLNGINGFIVIKDILTIQAILLDFDSKLETYLPLNGSKAMQGDLDLGAYHLSKLDTLENYVANVRAADFKFGSKERRGQLHPDDILGRALVDSSDSTKTNLTLNHASDWQHTTIGGKVYFDNLNTSTQDFANLDNSPNSLLLIDNANQVHKSNNLLNSLLNRISKLEKQPASTVPIGMIAIWGKPAPFPEGWEEYVPLRGRIPVGLDDYQSEFNPIGKEGGAKNKILSIPEMPPHYHHKKDSVFKSFVAGSKDFGNNSSTGTSTDGGDNTQMAIGNLSTNYDTNGDALERTVGNGQTFSMMNPYRVVHFIEYTGKPSNTAPASPTNLSFSNIGTQTLTLNWTAPTDSNITNYVIYKDNELLATVGNVVSYPVNGLSANTSYNFYVIAKNSTGNLSAPSQTESATTDKLELKTPTILYCSADTPTTVLMEWISSPAIAGIVSYEVYRKKNSEEYLKLDETINYYFIDTVSPGSTYYYQVRATDLAGNVSDFSEVRMVTISGGGGGSCFDIESPVTMASGQSKKLKNVVVGDKLQGFTFPNEIDESDGDYMLWEGKLNEATKVEVTVVNKQTSIQPNYYEIKTVDTTMKVTGEHPLLVTENGKNVKWLSVKNLSQKMSLVDKAGKPKAIESIVFKEESLEVALLDVENVDNYIICGITAHNKEIEQAQ